MADSAVLESGPEAQVAEAQLADAGEAGGQAQEILVTEELLVEEVSIDGMCGVY